MLERTKFNLIEIPREKENSNNMSQNESTISVYIFQAQN